LKRVLIWCGQAANQKALANKIASEFNVVGIVIEKKKNNRRLSTGSLISKITDRILFSGIISAWHRMIQFYEMKFPAFPDVKTLVVENINTDEAYDFSNSLSPDIIVVSGTSLIRKKLLSLKPTIGIVNLHTGLSPYVKGGPNCTNWCIANNNWQLIGNTIMWIDSGIDSGNIIASETVDVRKEKDLLSIHKSVMEHAHNLYVRTLRYLSTATPPFSSVPQSSIDKGNLYLTKMWDRQVKFRLLKNLRNRKYSSETVAPVCVNPFQ
jgi:methionyl-tRNA formyltransferase